jgi:cytochrome P450
MRVCRRETELAGEQIHEGEQVLAGIASANRDERIFDTPDDYRLDRGLPRHLSFSGGAHHCIGAGLARLVAHEAIGAFVARFDVDDIRLAPGFEFEGVPVFLEFGPVRLNVDIEK